MSGVDRDAQGMREFRSIGKTAEFPRGVFPLCVGIRAGVEFDDRSAALFRGTDLFPVGINEQTHFHANGGEDGGCGFHLFQMPGDVESAFRFSGTRQHAAGRSREQMATISSVTAISIFRR